MSLAQRATDAMGEGFTELAGPLLPALVAALVADAEPVDALVAGEDGWSQAYDLDATTVPGWLGQLAGVSPVPGTLQQQRDRVRARGYTRGTLDALRAAAQSTLTMTRTVNILERQGSAYRVTVQTYERETADPAATRAALLAVLPAGLQLTTEVLTGQSWGHLADRGYTFGELNQFTNEQIRTAIPGRPMN